MISYLQAIDVIRTFALNHYFINKFDFEFREQMPNLATLDEAYPLLFVVPIASDTIQNVNEFDIEVYCVDRYQKDRTNVNYVISDCNQTLNDLVLWLEEGQNDIEIVSTSTQTPINNDLLDYVGGWVLRLRLQVEKIGLCEIPFKGEQPTPPSCPSGFIRNSDESFTDIIPSGATVTLEDVRVTVFDQDTNVLAVVDSPSNINIDITVEVPPCPPSEVNAEVINTLDEIVNGALLTPTNNQILAPDAHLRIKKSGGTTIIETDLPSGSDTVQIINDSVITLKDSASATISTTSVQATDTANITAPDGAITVNGSSVGSVKSNGSRALLVKLNGTNSGTYDGVNTINVNASIANCGSPILKTGITTSSMTGDDGNKQLGISLSVLEIANPFGNTNRMTDILGGQTYTTNIKIDWLTLSKDGTKVIGWYGVVGAGATYATANSNALALSVGSFTSGWFVPNRRQLEFLMIYEGAGAGLNWSPLSIDNSAMNIWTSSRNPLTPTENFFLSTNLNISSVARTFASGRWLACRVFTVSGTTLS